MSSQVLSDQVSVAAFSRLLRAHSSLNRELSARLLNRGGTAMSDIPVQSGSSGQGMVELGLSALAAGDYVIELNAKTGTGSAKELVAFKVSR